MNKQQILPMLKVLRLTALKVAKSLTACNPHLYEQDQKAGKLLSPLTGHCVTLSFIIRGMFGGKIVWNRNDNQPHYWNRLESGEEIDLTSCQYGGDGFTPIFKGYILKEVPDITPFNDLVFAQLLQEEVSKK